ncbi:MAG: hypothetical protein ACXW3Z_03680 [Limisphaerales bacterium]
MKSNAQNDLQQPERTISKTLKRAVRPARKSAPATEELRGWAKSAIKSRNKS